MKPFDSRVGAMTKQKKKGWARPALKRLKAGGAETSGALVTDFALAHS